MNQQYSALLAEVVACRQIVEDYTDRIDKACVEYYQTGKTEFPNLSRAEDEDVHLHCNIVLSHLEHVMPDVMARWKNIKYPIDQYSQMIERMRDVMIRERNFFRAIESNLRTMLELDNVNATKPQEIIMGNKYSFGNITGSNVNVDSTLDQVTQNIGAAPNIDEAGKKQLAELIEHLKAELQKTPPEKKEDAEDLADSAKALLEAATKDQPNKKTVLSNAKRLQQAAEDIASVMPTVSLIAISIVKTVLQLAGGPLP